jgi:O-antigen ligase
MMDRLKALNPSHALALAALITPALAVAAPLGLSSVFIVAAVLVLVLGGWRDRVWMRVPRRLWPLLIAIPCWAAVTTLWAIDPPRSLSASATLAATIFAGTVLVGAAIGVDEAGRRRIGTALTIGLGLGCLTFVVGLVTGERYTLLREALSSGDFGPYRYDWQLFNRGITVIALVAWLTLLAQARQGRLRRGAALAAATTLVVLVSRTLSGKLALIVGIVLLPLLRRPSRVASHALAAVLALSVAAIAFGASRLPPVTVTASWDIIPIAQFHRVTIWTFAAARIAEKPLLGWGMDSSRSIPGGDDTVVIKFKEYSVPIGQPQMPLHPHSAVLQWWLELGAVGATLFAALLWQLGRMAAAPDLTPMARGAAASVLTGAFVISCVSYGFWQSWWQATLWLLAAWLVALIPAPDGGVDRP